MKLESFTALDFETATRSPDSVCQIGLVRVEHGEIVQKVGKLIQPPKNAYYHRNVMVHGIKPEDTKDAPLFEEVWFEVKKWLEDEVVVAHNASFDVNCLRSSLAYYDIVQPLFEVRCTRMIYRRGLAYLSKKYRIPLQHHDALSDAHACAQLYLLHLKRQALPKTGSLFD
ncbi:MAG: 3'-5' exonuclease [Bacteroidota bacterium]